MTDDKKIKNEVDVNELESVAGGKIIEHVSLLQDKEAVHPTGSSLPRSKAPDRPDKLHLFDDSVESLAEAQDIKLGVLADGTKDLKLGGLADKTGIF